jgi:hypothetical protein
MTKQTAGRRPTRLFVVLTLLCFSEGVLSSSGRLQGAPVHRKHSLRIEEDDQTQTINVYRDAERKPILTQNVPRDARPYLHPIVAPDGKGLITEYRPSHHPHQTGIFWGLKLVNGRDFFMKSQSDYYRKVSASVIRKKDGEVAWRTVYDMLDERGEVVITETQNWSMRDQDGEYILDLKWSGQAKKDVTMGKYYVGGLFVRMPWHSGMRAEAVNSAGQRNEAAEAQRSAWTDVGMQVDGRDDMAHVAILDHPDNAGAPVSWRVDTQFGIGPSRQIADDWSMAKGGTETFRYRLIIYTGALNPDTMNRNWKAFSKQH